MLCLGTSTQIARKIHICDSCGRSILPGNTYYRARVVDAGNAWVWKAHMACKAAAEVLFADGREGDDGGLVNVYDMDLEDRAFVAAKMPDMAEAIWGRSDA